MVCVLCGASIKKNPNPAPRCAPCYRGLMAERNRRDAPERMRKMNPMRHAGTMEKVSATLKRIGHKPTIRGGNGSAASAPVELLASALGWNTEIAVGVKNARALGLATCYKIDIGSPRLMIGIEVDGGSHMLLERQAQDRKKVAFLSSEGWTVLRFWNKDVMADLNKCVETVLSTISRQKAPTPTSPMA